MAEPTYEDSKQDCGNEKQTARRGALSNFASAKSGVQRLRPRPFPVTLYYEQ